MTEQKTPEVAAEPCLTAMELWEELGTDNITTMCREIGTNYEYFKHIAHNRRRPSVELARRVIAWVHTNTHLSTSYDSLIPPTTDINYRR